MLLDEGVRIDDYRIERPIGEGAASHVYLARDEQIGRPVALKIMRPAVEGTEEWSDRIRAEAHHSAMIVHPNVVEIHDVGEYEGSPYIVMEHVDGETLKDRTDRGPLPEDEALRIAEAVAAALEAAHDYGVVHADVKPGNVLLARDGRVKVADFGIARHVDSDPLTFRKVMGTVAYMSPEQIEGAPIDRRSDIYSFGAMLYEMLTGEIPFSAEGAREVAAKHLRERPTPPSETEPEVSREAESIALRALEKDPDDRFQTAGDLGDAIRGVRVSDPPDTLREGFRSNRVRVLFGGVAATILVLAGLLVWVFWPSPVTVPDVTGQDVGAAERLLDASDLEVGEVALVPTDQGPAVVVSQDPPPGEQVRPGAEVDLHVTQPAADVQPGG